MDTRSSSIAALIAAAVLSGSAIHAQQAASCAQSGEASDGAIVDHRSPLLLRHCLREIDRAGGRSLFAAGEGGVHGARASHAMCCGFMLGNRMARHAMRAETPLAPIAGAGAVIAGTAGRTTPLADHHTHVYRKEASSIGLPPILPEIELPAELAELLEQRESLVVAGGRAAVTDLFTEDAMVLVMLDPAWIRGSDAVRFAAENIRPFRFVPNAFAMGETVGYITGTGVFREQPSLHVTNFMMALRKGDDGKWRVAAEAITPDGPPLPEEASAVRLVAELDAAGIDRAVVLSVAFWFSSGDSGGEGEYAGVRAENDWVAQQVERYPERLVGFGSVNPLRDYAQDEIARIAASPHLAGLKLHLGNSDVDLRRQEHRERLRSVFQAANAHRMPIVIHTMVLGMDYGREHAELLLQHVLPAAPDVPVQIAHLAGSGPGYDADGALTAYIEAIAAGEAHTERLYFDVASSVTAGQSQETLALVAGRLRQLGLHRILFGSDRAGANNDPPGRAWDAFRRLPLTEDEFRTIASNTAPYLR